MFKSSNIRNDSRRKSLIRIAIGVLIIVLVSVPGLMTRVNAEANSAGPGISCGYDSICKSIEGNEFDMILYSAIGSEMVILYNESTVGNIIPKVRKSYYSRAKGTVRDAIYYLSTHTYYSGFRFKKARKSTGFFSSKVVDGLYVVIPEYENISDIRPPEYSFSEKDGKLTVRIRPVIRETNN